MKKTFKYYAIAWVLFLAVYNAVVFAVQPILDFTKNYDARFWIAWVFTIAAFIGQLVCAFVAFKAENKEKLFLSLPLITESYAALVLITIAGSIVMLIPDCPAWIAAVVCVVIFGFSAVSVIKAQAAAGIVAGVDEKVKAQTSFIRNLTAEAESLLAKAPTPEIRAEVKKVYEAVRYSDPMSSAALAEIEAEISEKFDVLSKAVTENTVEKVSAVAGEVVALVGDRNQKCKVLK